MLRRAITSVALTAPAATGARASEPLVIEPLHTLTFSASSDIYQIALTPDGRELFVQLATNAINLSALPLMYWPELGGAIVALVLLWGALRIRRVLKAPQRVGEPHCRRCGYCLTGCPSERCPECGRATRRVRIGRGFLRRTWAASTLMALVAGPYAAAWATQAPRSGLLSGRFAWYSEQAADWVARHKLDDWFPKPSKYLSRILVIDPASGQTLRRLPALRYLDLFGFSMETTPDGRGLFVRRPTFGGATRRSGEILMLDSQSGAVRARLPGSDSAVSEGRDGSRQILGFSPDNGAAYVRLLDRDARKTRIVRWQLDNGRTRVLLEREAEVHGTRGGEMILPPRFILVSADPLRVFEAPAGHGVKDEPVTFHVHELGSEPRITCSFQARVRGYQTPQVWPEGNQVWLQLTSLDAQAFDLATGRPMDALPAAPFITADLEAFEVARADRLMVFVTNSLGGSTISVRDLRRGQWIGALRLPSDALSIDDGRLSHDGRWLAARVTLGTRLPSGRYPHVLCIYDLSALDAAASRPAESE